MCPQLDITDDDFLSLMNDDGDTKDDVKVPEGEVGDKIKKLFTEEGKDTSESSPIFIHGGCMLTSLRRHCPHCHGRGVRYRRQGGSY